MERIVVAFSILAICLLTFDLPAIKSNEAEDDRAKPGYPTMFICQQSVKRNCSESPRNCCRSGLKCEASIPPGANEATGPMKCCLPANSTCSAVGVPDECCRGMSCEHEKPGDPKTKLKCSTYYHEALYNSSSKN